MTPNKVINAYCAIKEISGTVFPYKVARSVASLKRILQDEFDTIANAEQALVEKYGGKKNGARYDFEDPEKLACFRRERDDFLEQDADIKLPVVDLSKYTDMLQLSPNTIEALDSIVIFEKEEEHGGQ